MKRFLSIFLVLAMLLTLAPMNIFAADGKSSVFSDMKETDYYAQAATALEQLGVLAGYPDGTFGAARAITRAEMAAIVCRIIDKEADAENAKGETVFDDVSSGHWASGYINIASELGIVEGDGNGKFRPEDDVKHEEAIKMVVVALGFAEDVTVDPADWSKAYLDIADEKGVSADLKGAKGKASTRADVALMSYNGLVAKGIIKKPVVEKPQEEPKKETPNSATLPSGGSGGGSSRPSTPSNPTDTYTVSFDLNYEGATDAPEAQDVKNGELATMPNDPERENFMFAGWHTSKSEISLFDFEKNVTSTFVLYAHWIDVSDSTDTDGEGLTDSFEVYFGTDKNKQDTDEDGLNDHFELEILNTNPLKKDSDDNGVDDNLEDADNDGINNETEFSLNTNAVYYDTDHDLLSDYDEIYQYNTNPIVDDTDSDGVKDGDEVEIGSDPLVAERSFTTQSDTGEATEDNPITISVLSTTDAEGAGNLEIEAISHMDNYLISDSISGYLGYAYDLTTNGQLQNAQITFSYDESLGTIGEDFQPRIYYLNEETQEFEELPDQTVSNGKIVAEVNHFSTYILLNKVEFDKVWNTEIKPPVEDEEQSGKDHLDAVLVIDSSGSMVQNDPQDIRKTVAKEFVSKLGENDMAAVVDFDSYANLYSGFTSDKDILNTAVDRIDKSGGTNLGRGISLAINQFIATDNYNPDTAHKYIIMLTDGDGSYNHSLTTTAYENDIVIYTIGLGSGVKESVLKSIAEGTGGQYYFATVAENLYDIFDTVIGETIDYTTDSNGDGISDYYTKLINDGKLALTNTSTELACCTDIFGEESSDWDGDGLLNGEEIQVVIGSNGQPKIKMISHPFLADGDNDEIVDKIEILLGADPLKYTFTQHGNYKILKEPSNFSSSLFVDNYDAFHRGFDAVFDWNKTEECEKVLVDYFYDYASQASVEANTEKIQKQAELESVLSAVNSIIKITKNLKGCVDSTTGIEEIDTDMDRVRNFRTNVFKGLPEIFKLVNDRDCEKALEVAEDTLSTIKASAEIFDDLSETAENYLETAANATGAISDILSLVESIGKIAYQNGSLYEINLPVPKSFKRYSKIYRDWMGKEIVGEFTKGDAVSIGFEIVDLAANSADVYATYARVQANTEAYTEYLEAIDYISKHGNNVDFVKDAAGVVMRLVLEDEAMMKEWGKVVAKNSCDVFVALGEILVTKNPYVSAIKSGVDLGIALAGSTKLAKASVEILMADAITDAFIYLMDENIDNSNTSNTDVYFSVDSCDAAIKYLIQICQSRIHALNISKNFYGVKSVSTWLHNVTAGLLDKVTTEEMLQNIDTQIKNVYIIADYMDLKLSPKLPDYAKNNAGGGAGGGGGHGF